MSADPNKKSGRTFQCRDVLWDTFEQMARELECSVDYLINEAMKQYSRQRSYGGASRTPAPGQRAESVPPPPIGGQPAPAQGYSSMPTPAVPPPPPMRGPQLGPPFQRMPPPPPMRTGGGGLPLPPPAPGQRHAYQAPAPPVRQAPPPGIPPQRVSGGQTRSVPPPIPRGQPQPAASSNGLPALPAQESQPAGTLSVFYHGERLPVNKDRFVIGRGKQSSDLTLKDPNVSRQHAMVEFQNGAYFMVDMGSTNGVEYNGQRIARKQIAEGDVFKICDHEMRFTYR
jgi:hypothetical protein